MRWLLLMMLSAVVSACGAPLAPSRVPKEFNLTGVVRNFTSGLPVESARVEWTGLGDDWGDVCCGSITDRNGAYRLLVSQLSGPGSAERLFQMRASKGSFAPLEIRVRLSEIPPTVQDFDLVPQG